MCWSLFLINLQNLRHARLLKRDFNTDISSESCEIFKKTYFEDQLRTVASAF